MDSAYPADDNVQELHTSTVSRAQVQKYDTYDLYYKNESGLYSALGKFTGDKYGLSRASRIQLANRSVKIRSSVENLRNVVPRLVEFYANAVFSGRLEDTLKFEEDESDAPSGESGESTQSGSRGENLKTAITRVFGWSNLDQNKQVLKRFLATYGQALVKVVKPEGKEHCYLQIIKPHHVTDFEMDERSNVTYIRLDVADTEKSEDGQTRKVWRSEVWRKSADDEPGYVLFATSERTTQASVPSEGSLEKLQGSERHELGGDATRDSEGYPFDFVPFVVINAADTGAKRPGPVYERGLALMDWICREATRLSDMLYMWNRAHKVIGGMGNDAQGRPMPPPKPGNVRDLGSFERDRQADHTVPFAGERASLLSKEDEDISIEGIAVTGLPGNAVMHDATPNINYEAARNWINDHIEELHEELPELLYYSVKNRANQSGTALRTLIAGAVSRAEEMQDNLATGLAKATEMALTVCQLSGLEGFSPGEIGTYEDAPRGYGFHVKAPEILPLTEEEKQRVESGKLDNAARKIALGIPRETVFRELGYEDVASEGEPETAFDSGELSGAMAALRERLGSSEDDEE